MPSTFSLSLHTRLVFGAGTFEKLGALSSELGFRRVLLVADRGITALGLVDRAQTLFAEAGIGAVPFHDFDANPDTRMVEAGRVVAARANVDSIVAVGGGSSLDCAKGINFVLTNGGSMRDYRGHGKATKPMLPSIGVPTTAGTGSEAQSFALMSDADTHVKMACGDDKACFRVTILDPELTLSQPRLLSAVVGFDAVSHAVEAYVTKTRSDVSRLFASEAWRLLYRSFGRVLAEPEDVDARGDMLLGAHLAGMAIEQSMLGVTHACANPLTAKHGTAHGVAIAVMLPHVVRWNGDVVGRDYAELLARVGLGAGASPADRLADELAELARVGALPRTLRDLGVERADLPQLAAAAAEQWTGTHNPKPFGRESALELYEAAY